MYTSFPLLIAQSLTKNIRISQLYFLELDLNLILLRYSFYSLSAGFCSGGFRNLPALAFVYIGLIISIKLLDGKKKTMVHILKVLHRYCNGF
jgi:hypothetical protein